MGFIHLRHTLGPEGICESCVQPTETIRCLLPPSRKRRRTKPRRMSAGGLILAVRR